jgi:hypothetical protein
MMWRLWAKGWGVRAWAYWVHETWPLWVARMLPHRVALWAFIVVTANWEQGPGSDYNHIYDAWENQKKKRRKKV